MWIGQKDCPLTSGLAKARLSQELPGPCSERATRSCSRERSPVRPLAARGLLLLFTACGLSPCGAPPQGGSFYADDNLGSAWIEAAEVATITPETAIGWEENDEYVRNDN